MNQKFLLLLPTFIMAFVGGCSSYPDSAKGVAKAICKELKDTNLEGMKIYMSAEAILQMKERRKYLDEFFKSPEFVMIKKGADCNNPTQIKELDHGRIKVYFGKDIKVKVKELNGQWKMVI